MPVICYFLTFFFNSLSYLSEVATPVIYDEKQTVKSWPAMSDNYVLEPADVDLSVFQYPTPSSVPEAYRLVI